MTPLGVYVNQKSLVFPGLIIIIIIIIYNRPVFSVVILQEPSVDRTLIFSFNS